MANNNDITKNIPTEERMRMLLANGMQDVVQQLIETHKLQYIIETLPDGKLDLKDALKGAELHLKRFITVDPETIQMKDDVHKLAKCPYEILIWGETGTGKETIARAMIGQREGKTICVNCAGLPETLIESELFGYVKGSFTGAVGDRQGLLAAAKDGVVFLDEIGEMPIAMQSKLLRVIQEKKVRRVGATIDEDISCKIVCASNRRLDEMVSKGTFRQDLYARISTFELHIKPLRDRKCDVIPIIQAMKHGSAFLQALEKSGQHWTSLNLKHNVRSLQQYVARFEVLGRVVL
jgi:two-component system response regulator PilR (NtrC family)